MVERKSLRVAAAVTSLFAIVAILGLTFNSGVSLEEHTCEMNSAAAAGIRASFVDLTDKLLDNKGKIAEALTQKNCERVLQLVKEVQRVESGFAAVRADYERLDQADQEAVDVCFENTLQPTSDAIQKFVVDSLTQCAASNPQVAQGNALVDAIVVKVNELRDSIGGEDCVEMDQTMDEFSKALADFESHLAAIVGALAAAKLDVEKELVMTRADNLLLTCTDEFYGAWETKWESECALDADIIFEGGKLPESSAAPSAPSAEADPVDHAAGGGEESHSGSEEAASHHSEGGVQSHPAVEAGSAHPVVEAHSSAGHSSTESHH